MSREHDSVVKIIADMRGTSLAWEHSSGYDDVLDRYIDRLVALSHPQAASRECDHEWTHIHGIHSHCLKCCASYQALYKAAGDRYAASSTTPASGGAKLQDPELQRQLEAGAARFNELPQWMKEASAAAQEGAQGERT